MNENGDIPETYFDDRITLGIELTVFDINESNYELGAKTVLCLLLKHFTQRDFDPDKLKLDDSLLHLSNGDEMVLKNIGANVCNHMEEIGNLCNPDIPFTPDNPKDLMVEHVVQYVKDIVIDCESAYVQSLR